MDGPKKWSKEAIDEMIEKIKEERKRKPTIIINGF